LSGSSPSYSMKPSVLKLNAATPFVAARETFRRSTRRSVTRRRAVDVCTRAHTPRPVVLYRCCDRKEIIVLTTIIVVLLVLWLLGVTTSYTLGGLVHILLVIAIIVVLLRVIQGRNPLQG